MEFKILALFNRHFKMEFNSTISEDKVKFEFLLIARPRPDKFKMAARKDIGQCSSRQEN